MFSHAEDIGGIQTEETPKINTFQTMRKEVSGIMVCVGIYSVLVQSIATSGDISGAIWSCMGYTVLLCFALFKTGSLSKSLFGAH